jgi:hypothetical protein
MIICGIDPGAKGYISFLDTKTNAMHNYKIPYLGSEVNVPALRNIVHIHTSFEQGGNICVIERPHFMPGKMGGKSLFNMGMNYGKLFACVSLTFSMHEVSPAAWKNKMLIKADKESSILLCQKLYPSVNLLPGSKKKYDDNLAESILLIEYGRRYIERDSERKEM